MTQFIHFAFNQLSEKMFRARYFANTDGKRSAIVASEYFYMRNKLSSCCGSNCEYEVCSTSAKSFLRITYNAKILKPAINQSQAKLEIYIIKPMND